MHGGDITLCWEWKRSVKGGKGRPYFNIDGGKILAYHLTYEQFNGVELEPHTKLLHSCDNEICCNPHHVRPGTHQENMDDMKLRQRHGLPKIAVRGVKRLLEDGRTHSEIAELYGISREGVSAIAQGRSGNSVGVDDDT